MKKYSLILLAAAALLAAGCDDSSTKQSPQAAQKAPAAHKADYEQIWLPTPAPKAASKAEFPSDMRFVLDERAAVMDEAGKQIGELFEGTPVKLISEDAGVATVQISAKVVDNLLAYSEAGEFVYGEFSAAPSEQMTLKIASKSLTASHDDAFEAVELFYYDTCTSCHAAHAPHEHAMDEWDAYIGAMQMNAKINDAQKDRIVRYMQAHASDGEFKAN